MTRCLEDQKHDYPRLSTPKKKYAGRWSIMANGNWRLTFQFRDGNAYVLDYEDYH
ncbi:type II toxin-antitoxin system RelE/ParE family toxin [Pseudomonas sp. NFACC14]|uniref:type II toxin-antitoxin system RelE/ParE family toxin n=1 Tax=unclassified Pseudomonas TaxID=196821 RepID=UPI0035324AC6